MSGAGGVWRRERGRGRNKSRVEGKESGKRNERGK